MCIFGYIVQTQTLISSQLVVGALSSMSVITTASYCDRFFLGSEPPLLEEEEEEEEEEEGEDEDEDEEEFPPDIGDVWV